MLLLIALLLVLVLLSISSSFLPIFTPYELSSLILTGALVFVTLAYAYFSYHLTAQTKNLASETKKMRELQTNPKLSVYLTSSIVEVIFKNLVIENIGLGPAYNIKFEVNPDFTLYDGRKLREIRLIKDGIPYMPPNYKFEFLLTDVNYLQYADNYIVVKVTYDNTLKDTFKDEFVLDFSLWKNTTAVTIKGMTHIVDELKNININLEVIKSK